ncbi:hypothetical protein MASR2M79_12800 [Aminivibrio sp.]
MAEKWKDRLTDQLALPCSPGDPGRKPTLLEDVATIGEIKALAQRLEVSACSARGTPIRRSPSRPAPALPRSAG